MPNNLTHLASVFSQITDPRSKHGTYLPSSGILALTFLGLLAGQNYFTHIYRWAANHWKTLKEPLGFKGKKPPDRTTMSRLFAKISLNELQDAFAVFQSQLLQDEPLTAAVDGKTSNLVHLLKSPTSRVAFSVRRGAVDLTSSDGSNAEN